MPTITPFLWFDTQAEEAMNFYASIFPSTKILNVVRAQGRVMMVEFELQGQRLMGLNAGPHHKFTEAISLFVKVPNQQAVDQLWARLTADGGSPGQCGWLKDKFGLSWQIIPEALPRLIGGPDPAAAQRAMQAMMGMTKIQIEDLEKAYAG